MNGLPPLVPLFLAALALGAGVACSSTADPGARSPLEGTDAGEPDAPGASGGTPATDSGAGGDPGEPSGAGGSPAARDAGPPDAGASPGTDSGTLPPDAGLPPLVCDGAGPRFATRVVSHAFGPGQNVGQTHFPAWVLGPPVGAGECQGATTGVVSLGNGGTLVLAFDGNAIVDGPGADFIVFENAFDIGCDGGDVFAELATVSVSEDGVTWTDFPCTATMPPYGTCAGTKPVLANADTNTIDPTDPAVAGGDAFDLADVGVPRARFVRITDRPDLTGTAGVFDLDAVSIVHPACP